MSHPTIEEGQLCILLPNSLATGDPGDPLSNQVVALIRSMAELGYWPVDFGEDWGKGIELWFSAGTSKLVTAKEMAESFITNGGAC